MPLKKFGPNDIFHNQLKTYPSVQFDIYQGNIYYQNVSRLPGSFVPNTPNAPTGYVSLYEMNVDRPTGQLIYPFITKNGSLSNFRTISTNAFMADFQFGATLTGSYPLTASISREFFQLGVTGSARAHVGALENTLNYYKPLSPAYAFGDKGTIPINLISIPSIFYGDSIKKGTVDLQFYISGTLIGRLQDIGQNGELIETVGTLADPSSQVAGVVLYNEGFILLSGSWMLDDETPRNFLGDPTDLEFPSWLYFGVGANDGIDGTIPYVNYRLTFSGSNTIPTVTMMAHADKGEFNYSNNPTFLEAGQMSESLAATAGVFVDTSYTIKNTVESPYVDPTASFEKITYISKIGIYDEDKNLIGVATVATPVKKTLDRNLTFKLKLDF
jgi:hypothetical protein